MRTVVWPLVACCAGLLACGSESAPSTVDAQVSDVAVTAVETAVARIDERDAGLGSDWPAVPTSYWVQATITPTNPAVCGPGSTCSTPPTDQFLIRTEPDHHVVIGARGNAYRVSVQQAADGAWVTQGCNDLCFAIGANGFGGVFDEAYYRDFHYGSMQFRLGQSTLEGSAALASSTFYLGDAPGGVDGAAVLHGVVDSQPPLIDVFGPYSFPGRVDVQTSSPLLPLYTSEPLPGTTKAWLISVSGERIALDPIRTTFAPDLIVGFAPAAGWAAANTTYTVAVDPFVDLAGNVGTPKLRIVFTIRDAGTD